MEPDFFVQMTDFFIQVGLKIKGQIHELQADIMGIVIRKSQKLFWVDVLNGENPVQCFKVECINKKQITWKFVRLFYIESIFEPYFKNDV